MITTNKIDEITGSIQDMLKQIVSCSEDCKLSSDVIDHYDCEQDLLDIADFINNELRRA